MNVALLGFGTVGQAVARLILASSAPLTLTHICNRQVARKRVDWVPSSVAWTERFEDLLGPDAGRPYDRLAAGAGSRLRAGAGGLRDGTFGPRVGT